MLILTRKPGEAIIIGDDVTVKVLAINGGSVRVGITAPRDTIVDREEIREKRNSEEWDHDRD